MSTGDGLTSTGRAGEIKIYENQYLGLQEYNRLADFLGDKGFKLYMKRFMDSFGVFTNDQDFTSNPPLECTLPSSASGDVTVRAGALINNLMQLGILESDLAAAVTIPSSDDIYHVYAEITEVTYEEGTVDIAANGTLTGTNTLFTEVLRGWPSNPVKIEFPDSASNTGIYEISNVTNDTSATLNVASAMTIESGERYRVYGSHTPNTTFTAGGIYRYYEIGFGYVADGDIGTISADLGLTKFLLADITVSGGGILFVKSADRYDEYTATMTADALLTSSPSTLSSNLTYEPISAGVSLAGGVLTIPDGTQFLLQFASSLSIDSITESGASRPVGSVIYVYLDDTSPTNAITVTEVGTIDIPLNWTSRKFGDREFIVFRKHSTGWDLIMNDAVLLDSFDSELTAYGSFIDVFDDWNTWSLSDSAFDLDGSPTLTSVTGTCFYWQAGTFVYMSMEITSAVASASVANATIYIDTSVVAGGILSPAADQMAGTALVEVSAPTSGQADSAAQVTTSAGNDRLEISSINGELTVGGTFKFSFVAIYRCDTSKTAP